jgi:EAL and modified HD-GYP domain-containing signal transduction protein
VLRLGFNNLRRWVALVGIVNASSSKTARIIITRAQTCYEFASRAKSKQVDPAQAFLVGLLSGVDVLLGVDRDVFLGQLSLSESVCDALRKFEGVLGRNLRVVLNLEQAVQMKNRLHLMDERLRFHSFESAGKISGSRRNSASGMGRANR